MLGDFNEFERRPDLLAQFDKGLRCYSAAAVFADVQYRTGVMDSGIKAAFRAKITGQAITVQLSKGDLVDPLKALEMGQSGDVIVVDAGGDPNTSVCGGLMAGLAQNRQNSFCVLLSDARGSNGRHSHPAGEGGGNREACSGTGRPGRRDPQVGCERQDRRGPAG